MITLLARYGLGGTRKLYSAVPMFRLVTDFSCTACRHTSVCTHSLNGWCLECFGSGRKLRR